jgi:hypothetical protein
MKRIEIIVSPTGETKVTTKGFAGTECQQASRFVEEALGKRTADRLTSEFYAATPISQALRQSS